jgi:hypothetical protein
MGLSHPQSGVQQYLTENSGRPESAPSPHGQALGNTLVDLLKQRLPVLGSIGQAAGLFGAHPTPQQGAEQSSYANMAQPQAVSSSIDESLLQSGMKGQTAKGSGFSIIKALMGGM